MKVLHLNDKIEISGGVEVNINHIINYLIECEIECFWLGIYTLKEGYKIKEHDSNFTIEVASLNGVLNFIKGYVKENNVDLIHIHSLSNPMLIGECFQISPVIRSMRDPRMLCPGNGKFWRKSESVCTSPFGLHCVYHAYTQGCVNRHPKRLIQGFHNTYKEIEFAKNFYQRVIVMSEYMKEEALKVGFPESVLELNPHLTPIVENEELIDTSNSRTKRMLFLGRLSVTKGVHYFIQVGISLLEKGYDLIFDIVGDGHDRAVFENSIPKKYSGKFIFHGWQSRRKINERISKSYILLFTSIYPEAFGISGIEAMMYGKPVVGFNVGGVDTWLKNGISGFSVPVKDVNEMEKKIDLLISDKQLYRKISLSARDIALKEFSPNVHIKKLVGIYHKALN